MVIIGGTWESKRWDSSEPIYIVLRHIKQSWSGVNFDWVFWWDFLFLVAQSGEGLIFDDERFPLGLVVGFVTLVLEVGHFLPECD